MQKAYTPPTKNNRALQIAASWLAACGIPMVAASCSEADFGIQRPDGTIQNVAFAESEPSLTGDHGIVKIPPQLLLSYRRNESLPAFHVLTSAAGYGEPTPVERGAAPERAAIYGQDLFLTVVRHREFRDAPDLSQTKMDYYRPVIERVCRTQASTGPYSSFGYELDDLRTFALIWATIYEHRHTVPETNRNGFDNYRLLSRYLSHRFMELKHALMTRTDRLGDEEQNCHDKIRWQDVALEREDALLEDEAEVEAPVETKSQILARRKAAATRLQAALEALPHDKFIVQLSSQSKALDSSAKRHAQKMLKKHQQSCAICNPPAPDEVSALA